MKAELVTVIRADLCRRGGGRSETPTRIVVQYWSLDGDLMMEHDPLAIVLTPERITEIDSGIKDAGSVRAWLFEKFKKWQQEDNQ